MTRTFQVIDLLCEDFELFLQFADGLVLFLQLLHKILSPQRQTSSSENHSNTMTNESLRQKGEKYLNKRFILENKDKAGQPSIFKLCNNLKISALSCHLLNREKNREIVTKMGGSHKEKSHSTS